MRSHHLLLPPVNAAFSTASTGGTLVGNATYYYRVTTLTALGESTPSAETSQVVPATTNTNTITVNWSAVTGATGYKVYGRATGAEQFLVALGAVTTWTDTGSASPSGAMPTMNTASDGGTSVGGSSIRFKTADDDSAAGTITRGVGAAYAYSWVKQVRLYATVAAENSIGNLKVYFTGSQPTGVTLGIKTAPTVTDVIANAATALASTFSAYAYTATAPFSISGSVGAVTGQVGDFLLLQLGATSTATAATLAVGNLILRYDEQ